MIGFESNMKRLKNSILIRIILVLALAVMVGLGLNLRTRYFLSNQVDIGLVAVLEEIEQRAQIKNQADYTAADIDRLDSELLSGGAGAKRQLNEYRTEAITALGQKYPAGRSPDEARQTLIRSWQDKP